jgi:hypothetical protein
MRHAGKFGAMGRPAITEMSADDAQWAAALMEKRRRAYARYSPVFWRPAEGAVGPHAEYLARLIAAESTVALRTEHAFITCARRRSAGQTEGLVDDYAVDPPGTWDADGAALLLAAWERLAGVVTDGVVAVRVVTAHADRPKAGMLASLSLTLAEQWWVRELQPTGPPMSSGRISGPGYRGTLGPAPAVYDPGGPVFQNDRADEDTDADAIARGAAAHGAVLAVLPAAADAAQSEQWRRQGWHVASDWYTGIPRSAQPASTSSASGPLPPLNPSNWPGKPG